MRPGDCVLTVHDHFLTVPPSSTAARWLDYLYINVGTPASAFGDPLNTGTTAALLKHQGGDLFMSNCTLDGHSRNVRAVDMSAQPGALATQLYTDGAVLSPSEHPTTPCNLHMNASCYPLEYSSSTEQSLEYFCFFCQ